MPKFIVDVKEVWCHTIEVELPASSTKEQVLAAAKERLAEGEQGSTEYSHTLDPDTWNVCDQAGNYL